MTELIYRLYVWFYALNIRKAIGMALAAIILWMLLYVLFSDRNKSFWKWLCRILLVLSAVLICYVTLYRGYRTRQLVLQPFYIFVRAQKNKEAYRSAMMNTILFLPFGLTFPHILPERWKTGKRIFLTIAVGFLLSSILETVQYLFALGATETDDVICNVLGTAIAVLHLPLAVCWQKRDSN